MATSSPEEQLFISDEVISARHSEMIEAVDYVTQLSMHGAFLMPQSTSSSKVEAQPNPTVYKEVEDFVISARQNVEKALNEGDLADAA